MDPSPVRTTQPLDEEDEWDTDGFVIPSLVIEDQDKSNHDAPTIEASKPPSPKAKGEEKIYLGPHGAPPLQSKQQQEANPSSRKQKFKQKLKEADRYPSQSKQQQEANPSSRKQKFKQKLKEADRRSTGTGRENKVENLRELVGGEERKQQHGKGF